MYTTASIYRPHARQFRKPARFAILAADARQYPGRGALFLASMTANSYRLLYADQVEIQQRRSAPIVAGRSVTINGKETISATIATDNPNVFYRVKSTTPHTLEAAVVTAIVVKGRN